MRFIRFKYKEKIEYGFITGDKVNIIKENFILKKNSDVISTVALSDCKLLAPVYPSKVIGIAHNYKDLVGPDNAKKEPIIFLKSPTSVIGHNDTIKIPEDRKVWGEVELVIVIGKYAKNVDEKNANDYIFGYTIGNDVTMENIEGRDHHLARSKSCDTFCPIGPWIEDNLATKNLKLINKIDDSIYQEGNTENFIFDVNQIVALVSKFITLFPGDIILTGTPRNAMNSIIKDKSKITVSIANIGSLSNNVIVE